jgi:hypothetical protein
MWELVGFVVELLGGVAEVLWAVREVDDRVHVRRLTVGCAIVAGTLALVAIIGMILGKL